MKVVMQVRDGVLFVGDTNLGTWEDHVPPGDVRERFADMTNWRSDEADPLYGLTIDVHRVLHLCWIHVALGRRLCAAK
jgi:hypothetical protein